MLAVQRRNQVLKKSWLSFVNSRRVYFNSRNYTVMQTGDSAVLWGFISCKWEDKELRRVMERLENDVDPVIRNSLGFALRRFQCK